MAVRSGDDRQVCHRLLQRLALARRAITGMSFPPIPWPMTKKSFDVIANYILREYKGGTDIAKAIKELSLPTLQVPGYPKAKAGETVVDPGDVYI